MPNDPVMAGATVMAGAIKAHVSSGSRRIRSTTNPVERSLICAICVKCRGYYIVTVYVLIDFPVFDW